MKSAAAIVRRAARGLLYAGVFLVALEACARVDDAVSYGAPLLGNYSMDVLKVSDEHGIHGRPGARFEKWRMNALGLQGPEVSLARTSGSTRVLVIGASESFGLYESAGMSYPAQMQRDLTARLGQPVEVLNAALPGMSLPRATQYCQANLERLRPDVVVYYPSPAGYLDEDAPAAPVRPTREPSHRFTPRLLRRGENLVKATLPEAVQSWLRQRELRKAAQGQPESWFLHRVPEDRVELFRQHLGELASCVRESGARLVVGTHANRFHTPLSADDQPYLTAWRKFYPRADAPVLIQMDGAINQAITQDARDDGYAVADLARAVPAEPRNFADFVHFTDAGSTLAARAFAETVSGVVKPGTLVRTEPARPTLPSAAAPARADRSVANGAGVALASGR